MSNKSFKSLQKQWYKKLEESGFHDIESSEDFLKSYSLDIVQNHDHVAESNSPYIAEKKEGMIKSKSLVREAKMYYYRIAEHFLYYNRFHSKLQKEIWQKHSEGESYRNIAKFLNTLGLKEKYNKDKVAKIIKKLVIKMLIWDKKEQQSV